MLKLFPWKKTERRLAFLAKNRDQAKSQLIKMKLEKEQIYKRKIGQPRWLSYLFN